MVNWSQPGRMARTDLVHILASEPWRVQGFSEVTVSALLDLWRLVLAQLVPLYSTRQEVIMNPLLHCASCPDIHPSLFAAVCAPNPADDPMLLIQCYQHT